MNNKLTNRYEKIKGRVNTTYFETKGTLFKMANSINNTAIGNEWSEINTNLGKPS